MSCKLPVESIPSRATVLVSSVTKNKMVLKAQTEVMAMMEHKEKKERTERKVRLERQVLVERHFKLTQRTL